MKFDRFASRLKGGIFNAMVLGKIDTLFRHINRNKLLVVMYHGITEQQYDPPVWTQLPVDVFRRQLEFLKANYRIVHLAEVVAAIRESRSLPPRSALITFDDGLKNNFTVAFPVLRELSLPAAIFLTVKFIGTEEIHWFDELYLLMQEAFSRGVGIDFQNAAANAHFLSGRLWDAYVIVIEGLKRAGEEKRQSLLMSLSAALPFDRNKRLTDFGLLDWEEVATMYRSGLVDFGVHSATHRILSELTEAEWKGEVLDPKRKLEAQLGKDADAFCFPNGRPNLDYGPDHLESLRRAGYVCAFTTESALFVWPGSEPLTISRFPAGNDGTSQPDYFSLNTSGSVGFFGRMSGNGR